VSIRFDHARFARLAAIWAVVQAVLTKADVLLRLAEAAIFLASALCFRFVALRTKGRHCGCPSAA